METDANVRDLSRWQLYDMRNQELLFPVKWLAAMRELLFQFWNEQLFWKIIFQRSDYFVPGLSSSTSRKLISNPLFLFYISMILLNVASLKTILLLDFMLRSFAIQVCWRHLEHPLVADRCNSTSRTPSPTRHPPVSCFLSSIWLNLAIFNVVIANHLKSRLIETVK